jgi:cytochrome c6
MRRFFAFACFLVLFLFVLPLSCGQPEQSAGEKGEARYSDTASGLSGATIFIKNCKICHGADGRLGLNGAKDLSQSPLSISQRINIITNGKNLMTPFGQILSKQEIELVATFTLELTQSIPK